ncbi:T9SS type A sorting domain-containing protein [Larkinella insperata]|uniref:T9SS type A sorting domain-containing protein n=1 Tax=Larkinella insperata TaxID=332158 RepID=A0ABW3QJ72_9BACT
MPIPFQGYPDGNSFLVTITARGADGGGTGGEYDTKGGSGSTVQATFRVRPQPEGFFYIIVGQAGRTSTGYYGDSFGGGGGGSAVSLEEYYGPRSLLVAAGGGGGGSYERPGGGGQGLGTPFQGGGGSVGGAGDSGGGGGGGLNGPGELGGFTEVGEGGQPWLAGGGGGQARLFEISPGGYSYNNTADGGAGFGGGGAAGLSGSSGGGGGGGYGGGKGGGGEGSQPEFYYSQGGYSYVNPSGTVTTVTPGTTRGTQLQNGSVTIAFYELEPTAVTTFDIINAETDQVIRPLEEEGTQGTEINLANFPTRKLNIRANINTTAPGSIVFELSGAQSRTHIENSAPYALFEDNNGDFKNWTPVPGSYALVATPYSGPNGTGTAGTPYKVNFTVVDQLVVERFRLIDADQDRNYTDITDNDVIRLYSYSPNFNIQALTTPASVGSVVFQLGGTQTLTQIENEAPYAIFKDDGGNYRPWKPKPGSYTLTATPYAGPNGTGKAGIAKTIRFQVVSEVPQARLAADAESEPGSIRVFPNPFTESLTIESKGAQPVGLYDLLGRRVWQGVTTGDKQVVPVGHQLGAGAYILRVGEGEKAQTIKLLKTP